MTSRKVIRFEQGIESPNRTRNAWIEFKECVVISVKGISGLTQYEDAVEFQLKNKNIIQFPDFAAMHYFQIEVVVEYDSKSYIVFNEKDSKLVKKIEEINFEKKVYKVNDKFQVEAFEYEKRAVGTLEVFPKALEIGEKISLELRYTVSGEPILKNGKIRILTPFSCWSDPCERITDRFFTSTTSAKLSIKQKPYVIKNRGFLYEVTVDEGTLVPGDIITILHTNLQKGGVTAQTYMQDATYFLAWEDSSGTGIFNNLPLKQCGKVCVYPARADRFRVKVQQSIKEGQQIPVEILALDKCYNPQLTYQGTGIVSLEDSNQVKVFEEVIHITNGRGQLTIDKLNYKGLVLLKVMAEEMQTAKISLNIGRDIPQIYYGALHGHSEVSDGTYSMEEYFEYGKNYGMLDFCALTDHDWEIVEHGRNQQFNGLERLEMICDEMMTETFVTLPAYEWMGKGGHMNVYFKKSGISEVYCGEVSLLKEQQQYPTQESLLAQYQGNEDVLVLPHLSHGFTWESYDDTLQPVVEIYSQWGYSAEGGAINRNKPGFRYHLEQGKKIGFIAGADAHHGMPGQTGPMSKYSVLGHREGLTAIYSEELTRSAIFEGIKHKQVYATTGERILVHTHMESVEQDGKKRTLKLIVGGTAEIIGVKVYGVQGVITQLICNEYLIEETIELQEESPFYYIEVVQRDGEMAWSSPIFGE